MGKDNHKWKKSFCFIYYYVLAASRGLPDLSSLTRDRTHALSSPNHWTAREFPEKIILMKVVVSNLIEC